MTPEEFHLAARTCCLSNEEICSLFGIPNDLVRRWRNGQSVPKEEARVDIVRTMAMEERMRLQVYLDKWKR